ncbi:Major facilitator sugar transporter-like, partial [Trinorchestia longiramus]
PSIHQPVHPPINQSIHPSTSPSIHQAFHQLLPGTADNFAMLVVGRLFTGALLGINGAAVNTYVGEFSSADVRGYLGSGYHVMCSAGILYGYVMGMYLSWYNLAYVCLVPTLMCLFLMTFNPESPTFLLMKGRETEAAEALQRFRGEN